MKNWPMLNFLLNQNFVSSNLINSKLAETVVEHVHCCKFIFANKLNNMFNNKLYKSGMKT